MLIQNIIFIPFEKPIFFNFYLILKPKESYLKDFLLSHYKLAENKYVVFFFGDLHQQTLNGSTYFGFYKEEWYDKILTVNLEPDSYFTASDIPATGKNHYNYFIIKFLKECFVGYIQPGLGSFIPKQFVIVTKESNSKKWSPITKISQFSDLYNMTEIFKVVFKVYSPTDLFK